MAIIYTYPVKTTPNANDLILISDSQDSNKTKQVKISSLPGGSGSGVSSVTSANAAITVADPSTTPVLTSVAYSGGTGIGHVPTGSGGSATVYLDGSGNWSTPSGSGGDTYTLQAEAKSNNSVPLKLDAATGTDSTVNLTEGSGVTLTRNSATEITIAATGVSSFTNTNGTYISAGTVNSAATGAVTMGIIDLSAVDGTSDTTTRFLSKDNTWDVPSYTSSLSIENNGSALASGITTLDFSTNLTPVSAGPGTNKVTITSTDTTYNVMGSGNSYAAGLVLTGNATHNNEFLRKDGTWQTVSASATPSNPANSVQFNNSGAFGGSANLTFASDTLTVQDNILIKGDGSSDASKLKFNCYNNNHHVEIIGPDHANSPSSYSLTLPNKIASQTAYSSGGRVLESNASGALQWIDTPTAGVSPTSGTWFATLARYDGASYAANATQAQIAITTNDCQWYRVGDMMYYQFYIAGTIKSSGTLTGNLFLCRSLNAAGTTATYGLPTVSANSPTIVNNGFCNGSVTITESEAPAQPLTWTFPVNGGRVGRDTNYPGYVQLFSLNNIGATNKVYYPLSNQTWLTNSGEDPANWALGGTINALVEHAS